MKLGDLLTNARIVMPLEARTIEGAFAELLSVGSAEGEPRGPGEARGPPQDARARGRGAPGGPSSHEGRTRVRVHPSSGGAPPVITLGVSPRPLEPEVGSGEAPGARILVLVFGDLDTEALALVQSTFEDPGLQEALLSTSDVARVLEARGLLDLELHRPLRVEDVMEPLTYRIYPDTPVDEVLDLIARRRLEAVPVVDESLQVLGVISAGDALQHALRRRGKGAGRGGGAEGPPTARQIMTRSVLCVSEDQALLDAAQLMANRDTGQMPVVREGEIVGFLTRDGVLSALFGAGSGATRPTDTPGEADT